MVKDTLSFAKELVLSCGEKIRVEGPTLLTYKEDFADLLTNLDGEIETILRDEIHKQYPTHTVLGEEGGKELSNHTWIIDPIDGTTNFVTSHRDFAISLAYYEHKKPVFGLVYDVMRNELFMGIKGKGAYLNDVRLENVVLKPIYECMLDISMHSMLSILDTTGANLLPIQKEIRGHRSLGCASLSICHIAQGILDIYISNHVKCWDYAAACIILHENKGSFHIMKDFFTCERTLGLFSIEQKHIAHIQKAYLKNS